MFKYRSEQKLFNLLGIFLCTYIVIIIMPQSRSDLKIWLNIVSPRDILHDV